MGWCYAADVPTSTLPAVRPACQYDGGIRLAILISRTGDNSDSDAAAVHGSLESGTPAESYSDASDDFDLDNGVVYQHIEPMAGHNTHSHTSGVYGEIKIFYTLTYDHGSLVGDGHVNAAHIDSETADDGDVLTADGAGDATWETPASGGAITQATEATLGGVRGASALQAISSSGTDILGWTINRLQQLLSVSLPTMAQSDIDDATTGRKAVTGALIAANAGGGGGGTAPDRSVLADAVAVANTAGTARDNAHGSDGAPPVA